jgi:hypothetical protein
MIAVVIRSGASIVPGAIMISLQRVYQRQFSDKEGYTYLTVRPGGSYAVALAATTAAASTTGGRASFRHGSGSEFGLLLGRLWSGARCTMFVVNSGITEEPEPRIGCLVFKTMKRFMVQRI